MGQSGVGYPITDNPRYTGTANSHRNRAPCHSAVPGAAFLIKAAHLSRFYSGAEIPVQDFAGSHRQFPHTGDHQFAVNVPVP